MDNNNSFNYTYSAKDMEEIKHIREKYAPQNADRLELVRRLDRQVTHKATVPAVSVGVMGALIMGTGMSLAMVWQGVMFIPGIIVGLIGIAGVCVAYPLYTRVLESERRKSAPEILRLTEELMK